MKKKITLIIDIGSSNFSIFIVRKLLEKEHIDNDYNTIQYNYSSGS